jgi:hypothetical protein
MAFSNAQRLKAYRLRQREAGAPDTSRRNRSSEKAAWKQRKRLSRPFVGCDGEGAGVDELGRQNYLLFRMGERELYTGSRLQTDELLAFICDHPKADILVGFAFGYDVTMILRDLPNAQKAKLFEPKTFGQGHSPFVWYHDFDIDYLPKQYLKVRRVRRIRDPETGIVKREGVKGSTRIIYETFGFFQKSFLKVCEEFKAGTAEERQLIAASKERRGDDEWAITQTERDYCALECRMLAELMERLREYCEAADMRPKSWNGAGKLAKALLAKHNAPKAAQINEWVPKEVRDLANMAYYGGRFEITRTGLIDQEVYEYDIGSAYPDGMRRLPCLQHGKWCVADSAELRRTDKLFVAVVTFNCERIGDGLGQLGGLPIRSKEGHLYWPLRGGGVYWSPEIRSAERMGFNVRYKTGWTYHTDCECQPFDWIEPLFDYRKSIGKSGPGYPIKLGINSLYGAQAQRVGTGVYANMVYAGLTTAQTRARLNDAISLNPNSIVMLATDGVYSTEPLALPIGDKLGDWELQRMDGLFIVQPGLYWCPEKRKRKSRGLSGRFFEEPGRTEGFEDAWAAYMRGGAPEPPDVVGAGGRGFPSVEVPVPGFIGIKLAHSRNKPDLAGTWVNDTRLISFDYGNKRVGHRCERGHIVTGIKPGSPGLVSLPHRDFLAGGGAEPWEAARHMLDEQPDYVDLGIPFKD